MSLVFSREALTKKRAKAGMSSRALALKAGLRPQTLNDIESGETADPGTNKIAALANALGCALEDLFESTDDETTDAAE